MNLLRLYVIGVALCGAILLHAQTQQGYVKTLGRPNQKGQALSGVTIRVKGGHNAVLSSRDGTFALTLTGKKLGESYQLQQVQKQGYELCEQGVIGRSYAYSDQVALAITMVNSRQLQADKERIETKAFEVAEKTYQSRLSLLEQQREQNAVTIEQYREQLQHLQDKFEKYQSLIDQLADHYARVDYDHLDETERTVNLCIENGDLERADSLLRQLGVYQLVEDIDRRLKSGHQLMTEANREREAVEKQQEKDAEYLYQLYTIALARYDNDKAGFYIETRAKLDTMNAVWQFDAAYYLQKQNQYGKSSSYYERTLQLFRQLAQSNVKIYETKVTTVLNNLANLYTDSRRYVDAEKMYKEVLELRQRLVQSNPQLYESDYAHTLNNLAVLYYRTRRYADSEPMFKEALEIRQRLAQVNPQTYESDVAMTLNNLAAMYNDSQRYVEAESMYLEALEIKQRLAQSDPQRYEPDLALTLNNLALLYTKIKRYTEGEAKYKEALAIYHRLVQRNPQAYEPYMAQTLLNLAIQYYNTKRYAEAKAMYQESLAIYQRLAEHSPQVYKSKITNIQIVLKLMASHL